VILGHHDVVALARSRVHELSGAGDASLDEGGVDVEIVTIAGITCPETRIVDIPV
jgi:hypothetical protein